MIILDFLKRRRKAVFVCAGAAGLWLMATDDLFHDSLSGPTAHSVQVTIMVKRAVERFALAIAPWRSPCARLDVVIMCTHRCVAGTPEARAGGAGPACSRHCDRRHLRVADLGPGGRSRGLRWVKDGGWPELKLSPRARCISDSKPKPISLAPSRCSAGGDAWGPLGGRMVRRRRPAQAGRCPRRRRHARHAAHPGLSGEKGGLLSGPRTITSLKSDEQGSFYSKIPARCLIISYFYPTLSSPAPRRTLARSRPRPRGHWLSC